MTTGNITDNVILVDRNWTYGELKLVKTGHQRTVEGVTPLKDDLRLFLPRLASPDDIACPNEDGGYLDLHNWRRRVFSPACKRAAVKVTPYELRHTYCSLLAHEGRSAVYIAAAMGHSLIETQSRYSHIIEDARLSPMKPMVEAIFEARVELADAGLSSACLSDPPSVLRRSIGSG
jgi:integrase